MSSNCLRTLVQELIVFFHRFKSIVSPVITEMLIDLVDQLFRERLVCKPCQQCHPVIKFRSFVFRAHSSVIVLNNLDEVSHNLREENNTNQHDDDTKKHLNHRDRIEVTITHSWKCGERKVANDNELSENILTILVSPSHWFTTKVFTFKQILVSVVLLHIETRW